MGSLRRYILAIVTAAILGGILTGIVRDGSCGKLLKLMCGVFFLLTAIQPITGVRIPDLSQWVQAYSSEAEQAAQWGENYFARQREAIIKEKTEAYILDKAGQLGLQLQAEVSVSETEEPVPWAVVLSGEVKPDQKRRLEAILEQELGIARENQQWQ